MTQYAVQVMANEPELGDSADDGGILFAARTADGQYDMGLRSAKAVANTLARHGCFAAVFDEDWTVVHVGGAR